MPAFQLPRAGSPMAFACRRRLRCAPADLPRFWDLSPEQPSMTYDAIIHQPSPPSSRFKTGRICRAALIGAAVVVIGRRLNVPSSAAAATGAVLCFGIRLMAMRRGWQLPIAHPPDNPAQKQPSINQTYTQGGSSMSATVLVCGNRFEGSSEERDRQNPA
jgi:hypothetical protein